MRQILKIRIVKAHLSILLSFTAVNFNNQSSKGHLYFTLIMLEGSQYFCEVHYCCTITPVLKAFGTIKAVLQSQERVHGGQRHLLPSLTS